jgi:hypothetical protein
MKVFLPAALISIIIEKWLGKNKVSGDMHATHRQPVEEGMVFLMFFKTVFYA